MPESTAYHLIFIAFTQLKKNQNKTTKMNKREHQINFCKMCVKKPDDSS